MICEFRIGDCSNQGVLGLARIEPRVLHDDRNVRLDEAGVVGISWDRLRVGEVIEAEVPRAPRGNGHSERSGRLAVAVEDGDRLPPIGLFVQEFAQETRLLAETDHNLNRAAQGRDWAASATSRWRGAWNDTCG